ncbi:DUF7472 family protein [Halorhabdus rudnickae]|uniref:DUF7472 family protein n=1 Tax=Halorhabdus rudnickae TaxID=1775544 RepID=UPI001082D7DF|nr:hypothetical protein [Halorhabdus rudnickae]
MDRETQLQVVVSSVVVVLFIGVLATLSTVFSTSGNVTQIGGYALVTALFGFIVTISAAGLLVTRYGVNDDESGSDDKDDDN